MMKKALAHHDMYHTGFSDQLRGADTRHSLILHDSKAARYMDYLAWSIGEAQPGRPTTPSDTSPFARGVSAFAAFDIGSLSVEFACQDTLKENAGEISADFLTHCHCAAEQ